MLSAAHLQLLIGPSLPVPAPIELLENLHQVEVRHTDTGASGFSLTVQVGRRSFAGIPLYDLEASPLVARGVRVVITVVLGAVPHVLMDGIVTEVHHNAAEAAGASTLTLRGRDLTALLDLTELDADHPAQSDDLIVTAILARYAEHGIVPRVIPPVALDVPLPIDRVPKQRGTDLSHIQGLARKHGYVFYLEPGPVPLMSTAYWGPPVRLGLAQRALSVNMGPFTNVGAFQGSQQEQGGLVVEGQVQDRMTGESVPVRSAPVSTRAPLAAMPSSLSAPGLVRTVKYDGASEDAPLAFARAQAQTDRVADRSVRASGTADGVRYGDLLKPRQIVGVRGAGMAYNGNWYVEEVTHTFRRGAFTQQFQLSREGVGPLLPVVVP